MKRILLFFTAVLVINWAKAQQKYHAFNINGKYGITDTLGNEAIKPTYAYKTIITAKNQIYLQDFSEKPDIIFNVKTGSKQLYESIYNNKLQIKNVPYSIVIGKSKRFLLSEETDQAIPLARDYDRFTPVGQYIIASYDAQAPFVSGGKDKNGRLLPPKIRPIEKKHVVLTNDENLKIVLNTGFDEFLPLYKVPEKKKEDGTERVRNVELILSIKRTSPNCDYIVLSQGSNHKLYNKKMILVKAFILAKPTEDKLLEFSKKILKADISMQASSEHGLISAPPMMAPSSGRRSSDPEQKKPFKPFFYIKKLENGHTIFALQETEEISKRIFDADVKTKVRLFERDCTIRITIDGKEDSEFSYNPKTGEIYIPKVYLAELGITLI